MLPDLNRLGVFLHVHREGSVTAAAARLHVSQSAVSQSLAKLEEEIGTALFVRRHRALTPTPAADALLAVVAPFVEQLHEVVADLQRRRDELVGTLRVGAPVEFGTRRLVGAFAEFRRAYPEVELSLRLGHPSEIVGQLQDGRLDLAFADVFGASRWAGVEVIEVAQEQLVVVGSRRYVRRALGDARTFDALSAVDFVAYEPRAPGLRAWFRHHFGRTPHRLNVTLSVESVPAVLEAVQRDLGLGLVPAPALEGGRLVTIETRRKPLSHPISLVRRLDDVPTRLQRTFVRFARDRDWTAFA